MTPAPEPRIFLVVSRKQENVPIKIHAMSAKDIMLAAQKRIKKHGISRSDVEYLFKPACDSVCRFYGLDPETESDLGFDIFVLVRALTVQERRCGHSFCYVFPFNEEGIKNFAEKVSHCAAETLNLAKNKLEFFKKTRPIEELLAEIKADARKTPKKSGADNKAKLNDSFRDVISRMHKVVVAPKTKPDASSRKVSQRKSAVSAP
jgi:hypothetical protein